MLVVIRSDGGPLGLEPQQISAGLVHLKAQFPLRLVLGLEVHRQGCLQDRILVKLPWRWRGIARLGDLHGIKLNLDIFDDFLTGAGQGPPDGDFVARLNLEHGSGLGLDPEAQCLRMNRSICFGRLDLKIDGKMIRSRRP